MKQKSDDDVKYMKYYQDECIVKHDKSSWCGEHWHSCHMRWSNNWTNGPSKVDSTVIRQSWQGELIANIESSDKPIEIYTLQK